MNKTLQVTHGPRTNPTTLIVELDGVLPDERLTPKLAAQAARIACGHRDGVTVQESNGDGYRLYRNTARKVWEMDREIN